MIWILLILAIVVVVVVVDTICIQLYRKEIIAGVNKVFDSIKTFIWIPMVDWISGVFDNAYDDDNNEIT